MSSVTRPPLLAFGLTDRDPAILRAVISDVVRTGAEPVPPLLAFGLVDQVPSLRASGLEASGRHVPADRSERALTA
jgi:hypothetical protein